MSEKKPLCAYELETACTCPEGECWAARNSEYLGKVNMLLGYGLQPEEVADDMKGERLKP